MMNLPPLSKLNLVAKAVFALALIGFADASYLTAKFFLGGSIPCSILGGCDTVTKSAYASIAGVPIALLGALFYLTVLILVIYYLDSAKSKIWTYLFFITLIGFLFSIYFVFLQVFIIKALCLYCLISAVTSTALFCLCFWARKVV